MSEDIWQAGAGGGGGELSLRIKPEHRPMQFAIKRSFVEVNCGRAEKRHGGCKCVKRILYSPPLEGGF